MSGCERLRPSRSCLGGEGERSRNSQATIRIGRIQPQHPGHRTIYCNDREANLRVKFKRSRKQRRTRKVASGSGRVGKRMRRRKKKKKKKKKKKVVNGFGRVDSRRQRRTRKKEEGKRTDLTGENRC